MFDKLVVSARKRPASRTARFFLATSVIYLLSFASAIAISVLVSTPKLADTDSEHKIHLVPSPRPAPGPRASASARQQGTPRPDIYRPALLDEVSRTTAAPPVIARPGLPPSIGPVDGAPAGAGGDSDARSGYLGPPGNTDATGETNGAGAPKPADMPKPTPTPRTLESKSPLRVATTVLQGKAIERRTPGYPPIAKQIKLQGAVSVEVIISPEGRVELARAINGHPILKQAATEAAYGWRFQPTLLGGAPVRVTGVITFVFKLE